MPTDSFTNSRLGQHFRSEYYFATMYSYLSLAAVHPSLCPADVVSCVEGEFYWIYQTSNSEFIPLELLVDYIVLLEQNKNKVYSVLLEILLLLFYVQQLVIKYILV